MDQPHDIAGFDLTYAGQMGDAMFAALNRIREAEPVYWDEYSKCWMVTRHEDIVDALRCKVPVSNLRLEGASIAVIPPEQWAERLPTLVKYSPYHITNMDPPTHTRMRLLLTRAFGRPVVESLRPFARSTVAELIQSLHETPEVEFADVALALPGKMILKLLGLPDDIYPRLRRWAHDVMLGLGTAQPEPDWVIGADRAFGELTEAVLVQIRDRRTTPHRPDDFISSLVYAKNGKDGLSDDEIVGVLQVVVIAGHDTTANSMTLGVNALARNPDAWRYMGEHPEQIMDTVLELMRYSAMSAAQNRRASGDFIWHGKQIRQGDTVFLMFAAGNRDPRAYDHPDALDLTRKNDQSLTFGPGLHHCIGHMLAKMQLTEFFAALTRDFSGAEILDDDVRYSNILVFRAILSLHLRFHAALVTGGGKLAGAA